MNKNIITQVACHKSHLSLLLPKRKVQLNGYTGFVGSTGATGYSGYSGSTGMGGGSTWASGTTGHAEASSHMTWTDEEYAAFFDGED